MTTFSHQYAQTPAEAIAAAQVHRHIPVRFRRLPHQHARVIAFLASVLLHGLLAWGAMQIPFKLEMKTTDAELALKQGETADQVNVRMVNIKIDTSQLTFTPPVPKAASKSSEAPAAGDSTGGTEGVAPETATDNHPGTSETVDAMNPAASPSLPPVHGFGAVAPVQEPAPVDRVQASAIAAASPNHAPRPIPPGHASSLMQEPVFASVEPMQPRATGVDSAVTSQVALAAPPLPLIELAAPDITPPLPSPDAQITRMATPTELPSSEAQTGVRQGVNIANLPKPSYPVESRRLKEEGKIVLDVQVLADGSVGRVEVVSAPEHQRLIDAAIEAVRKAKFVPATVNGRAVEDLVRIPFIFRLE